jgi:hypothetical protein
MQGNIKNIHVNNLMLKLQNSGYKYLKYRMEILISALLAFDRMLEDSENHFNHIQKGKP